MRSFAQELRRLDAREDGDWPIRLDMLERMRNLVVLVRADAIVFVNSSGLGWLSYGAPEEILGAPFEDLLHSDYAEIARLGMEALSDEQMIPIKLLRKSGAEADAEMWVSRLDVSGPDTYLVEARDVTEHLRSARALRSREQRLEGIINTVADGIITIDDKGVIQTFNPAAERIFRFSASEVLGRNVRLLVPDPVAETMADDIGIEWQRLLAAAAELHGKRKDGKLFPMEIAVREMSHGGQVAYTSVVRDITARRRAEEHIRHLAHHDHLTGLPNRFLFGDRLEAAINRSIRNGSRMALVFIDLDHFKPVNDRHGHAVGDALLRQLSADLTVALRKTDTIARLGGDEFVAILEDIGSSDEVDRLARKIIETIAAPKNIASVTVRVGASLGIAMFPDQAATAEELISLADSTMYRAKQQGRMGYCFAGDDRVSFVQAP